MLLDQNIQYLLFNFRQPLHEQPSRTSDDDCLLNVDRLMRNCVRAMARGQPYPVDKIVPGEQLEQRSPAEPPVIFDVLTLRQPRLQSLLEELEKRRVPAWVKQEISQQHHSSG